MLIVIVFRIGSIKPICIFYMMFMQLNCINFNSEYFS